MNEGKICVSVCAETSDELIEQIKRAEELADVVEIRFDCLNESEFARAAEKLSGLNCKKPYLATFRPKSGDAEFILGKVIYESDEHRGRVAEAVEARKEGWKKILTLKSVKYVDFEIDLHLALFAAFAVGNNPPAWEDELVNKIGDREIIISEHFFDATPTDINVLRGYEDLAALTRIFREHSKEKSEIPIVPKAVAPSILKIAAQAHDITESLILLKYFREIRHGLPELEIIPIAMGEAGKWTRILGLAHGAFMTYAALETGSETAPGQISARDLIEVYRAKELDERTEIYGIVGGNTGYSMSPYIHNAAFKFHNLNAVFVPLQVQDSDEFMRRMVKPESREIELNFRGFAVTIPHKQNIVGHLDFIDETAREIGAVNTVKIDANGKLSGYNTDAPGFIEPLLNAFGDLQNAKIAVVGAGGASRAVCYALRKAGAEVAVFARNPAKAEQLKADFGVQIEELSPAKSYDDFDILVNATPLGTKGEMENETPAFASQLANVKLVYDLIYNPFETKLIKEAKKAGVPTLGGLSMLVAQAAAQQKIWTSTDAPVEEMSAAALRRLA